jgi:A/G-specific adenine glycosylase
MLQQTRIETVIPYYRRFLKAFPSLPRLARAPLPKVLKLWAGMGYYARARNLHAAAKIIARDLAGKIPDAREALLRLPGFGPYTAGAVASIAFNRRTAALDGNVKRVLGRLSGAADAVSTGKGKKQLEVFAQDLIPEGRASEFNQALMDLGATVCLSGRPKCPLCPVRKFCRFLAAGRKEKKLRRKKRREEIWAVALVENKGRFLIHRKEDRGLLGGLWQFPAVVFPGEAPPDPAGTAKSAEEGLRRHLRDRFGLKTEFRKPLAPLRHEFTHIRATLSPYLFSLSPGRPAPQNAAGSALRWVKLPGLSRYPVSRAMMKIADLWNEAGR